jgi:hypothetical protein
MKTNLPFHHILPLGLTIIGVAFSGSSLAQGLPATDLWLTKIEKGVPVSPLKISPQHGYNNQPHFSDDGSVVFYTREMPGNDSAQTDIAAYDTKTSKTRMVNNTPESEYSPTPIPGRNAVSVIQADLKQKQYLYAIDVATGSMELLLPDVEPVGYHVWVNEREVAMFILGDSFTLQTARLGTAGTKQIADNIGRSLRKHPESGEILFVDKNTEPWKIAAYSPETKATRMVMPLFPGNEDFTIDSNGTYWTGNGSKLYQRRPTDSRWLLVADFSNAGVEKISRLAINLQSGQMALVSDNL